MEFRPKDSKLEIDIPYFEDSREADGWRGMSTSKSLDTLKSEVITAVSRLGGLVAGFQTGEFLVQSAGDEMNREGFVMHYHIEAPGGQMIRSVMKIAALPVKRNRRRRKSLDTRREKSLRMALYMTREALDGLRFLEILSPGFAPLMP